MNTIPGLEGSLVLLAEDNEVNQFVAVHLLEKHGLRVDVAANGRVATEMCLRRTYTAVFMDCHMPEVDGYQATAEIRRHEGPGRRVPIIAMTADVMNGARERCLAAGMDDYVGKPIDPVLLKNAIARSLQAEREVEPPIVRPVREVEPLLDGRAPLLDRSVLDAICDGDTRMLQDLVGLFADQSEAVLADMNGAARIRDLEALQHLADRLKRSSASVGAVRMADVCERMLQAGAAGRVSEALGLMGEVERAARLTRAAWYAGISAALATRRP